MCYWASTGGCLPRWLDAVAHMALNPSLSLPSCPRPECRNTPGALYTLATLLLAAGPALVYFTPDDNTGLIVAQVLGALLCVGGGAAAYGGASLLSSLQK